MSHTRVLALVSDAFGSRGGIAQYNRDLLTALADDCDICVLPRQAPDPRGALPARVAQRRPIQSRAGYSLVALVTAMRFRPDIVFAGHLYMASLGALVARLCGAQLVVQTHGIEAWPRPSRAIRAAVDRAALMLAVSRATRHAVLGWTTLDPDKAAVLPNTVGAQFSPGDRTAARARFGFGDARVLLTVGRLAASERYKGHERVIATLPQLVARGLDVRYVIAGDGDDRARLERIVAESRLAERVTFLGAITGDALPDLYRAADVFVMPSTGEGFGIAYLEAMACGTPALGLAIAGACDPLVLGHAIDDGPDVAVAAARLAAAIAEALATPIDRSALAAAVERRFGLAAFRAGARAAFDRCLEPGPAAAAPQAPPTPVAIPR